MAENILRLVSHILSRYVFNMANAQAVLRLSTPVVLAALAALITERAGMLNIAAEGIINFCTFSAIAGAFFLRSTPAGITVALLTGLAVSGFFALLSLRFRADFVVIGLSINIFAIAATMFAGRVLFKQAGSFSDPSIVGLPPVKIPVLAEIPVLGPLLSGQSPITYLVWILVPLTQIFLYRTKWGLRLRAVGENPQAAETLGVNVLAIRFAAILASGVFAALAGIYLSLSHLQMYSDNMAAGRGFMGMSASTFGSGEPVGAFLASMLFGLAEAIGWRLHGERLLPPQFVNMLPYAATLFFLAAYTARRRRKERQALETTAKELERAYEARRDLAAGQEA